MKKIPGRAVGLGVILTIVLVALFTTVNAQAAWKKEGDLILKNGYVPRDYTSRDGSASFLSKNKTTFLLQEKLYSLSVQALDKQGRKLFGKNGVILIKRNISDRKIISDGLGGAIVSYLADGNIYIQKISKNGKKRWSGKGILLTPANTYNTYNVYLASDRKGGAIVSWFSNSELYVTRINWDGAIVWQKTGKTIFQNQTLENHHMLLMLSDKSGNIYIESNGLNLQKLNPRGQNQWGNTGIKLSPRLAPVEIRMALSDNHIIVIGNEIEKRTDFVAEKFNSSGKAVWPRGVIISDFGKANDCDAVSDGKGGIIVGWHDKRTGINNIYMQRINSLGKRVWGENDKLINDKYRTDGGIKVVASDGGAVIAWNTKEISTTHHATVCLQKINRLGTMQWQKDGIDVPGYAYMAGKSINTDGKKGFVAFFEQQQSIYAYHIDKFGNFTGE